MDILVLGFKSEYANGKEIEWVHFTAKGAMNEVGHPMHSTWERVKVLIPTGETAEGGGGLSGAAMRANWAAIEPHYLAWKEGSEIPDTGTPLAAWSGVTADQAAALKKVGLRTVDDVATLPEALLAKPPLPNMRELQTMAKAYIDGQGSAQMAAQIAALQAQNAAMLEMLAEQTKPDEAPDAEKRGPGRPRKEAA